MPAKRRRKCRPNARRIQRGKMRISLRQELQSGRVDYCREKIGCRRHLHMQDEGCRWRSGDGRRFMPGTAAGLSGKPASTGQKPFVAGFSEQ